MEGWTLGLCREQWRDRGVAGCPCGRRRLLLRYWWLLQDPWRHEWRCRYAQLMQCFWLPVFVNPIAAHLSGASLQRIEAQLARRGCKKRIETQLARRGCWQCRRLDRKKCMLRTPTLCCVRMYVSKSLSHAWLLAALFR